MDRGFPTGIERKQCLRVDPAQCSLQLFAVEPVTLEHCWIRMSDPLTNPTSSTSQASNKNTTTSNLSPSISPAVATSSSGQSIISSSKSATSLHQQRTPSGGGASSTISSATTEATTTTTTFSAAGILRTPTSISASLPYLSSTVSPTSSAQTSTTSAAGAASAPSSPPVRLVELAQAQKQPQPCPTMAATTVMSTMAAVSSAGPGTASGAAPASTPRTLVGGQRPLGEESPVIILTTAVSDESNTRADKNKSTTSSLSSGSDKPGSDRSPSRKRATQEHVTPQEGRQKPEETTLSKTVETPKTTERGREVVRRTGKPIVPVVQFSEATPLPSPKRDENDVMQFFKEQEKSLQESFLSLPKHQQQQSQRKKRSPSPKVHQTAPGLEHLDNLVRLMEQLSSLKDENSRLRKRCDYLESTKVLLQAKRDLSSLESSSSSSGIMTTQSKHKHHHHHHLHRHHHHHRHEKDEGKDSDITGENGSHFRPISSRPRLSSAEELGYLHIEDTSSDQRPKRQKSGLTKRSFSTGSLEIPSELLDQMSAIEGGRKIKSKHGRGVFGKSVGAKGKSKASKWARVKKVLTGQKLYEELGTTIRTIRDLGRSSSHVRYSGGAPHDISPPTSRITSSSSGGGDQRLVPDSGFYSGDGHQEARPPLATASSYPGDSVFKAEQESVDSSLTSEIWMGPPDWWEEYEASKESNASTGSDVGTVIEVTTMYLGTKKEPGESDPPSPSTNQGLTSSAPSEKTQEQYLSVEKSLPRRQSSPSLSTKETGEEDDILDELAASSDIHSRPLHKSSSCKSADLDLPKTTDYSSTASEGGRHTKKSHRTAWGRVKDIIHTRKDSIKKRPKREKSSESRGFDSEETSEVDMEAFLEDNWRSTDSFGEGLLSRSTPKTSPIVIRQQSSKAGEMIESTAGTSQPPKVSPSRSSLLGTSPGNVDLSALLAGGVSDEFTKKMQEWEQKKSRKSSVRVSADESDLGSLDVSSASQEFPVRTIDLRDYKGPVPDGVSEETTPQESHTSMEVLGAPNPSINVEEIQRRMTGSFSRKMQEWEKLKYRSQSVPMREPSPEIERKGSKGRKDDRQKSKRSRVEKEKEKMERQRERDMQKVEREQMKLEKEKLRIEKERLRALEREAKLEKLKGRLSQPDTESGFKNPVLSPLAEYKVTADFARKLHEWELKKGLSHDVSNSIYLEAQKLSMQHLREDQLSKSQDEDGDGKTPPVHPLTLQAFWDSPEESSPVEKYSEMSLDDVDGDEEGDGDDDTCTSVTEEYLTKSNIISLERANQELLENLQRKELEYAAVQKEVQNVNEKLAKVREEHSKEMARFHRELALGSVTEPVKLEVGELESTMTQMEDKIKAMENFGERLALSMESAAVGKWSSVEGEGAVHTQLVELVDQMRGMLVQASQSEEKSQKTMALTNFETLYSQAMKLQVQMNNLRLSHLERNREIMVVKRQLLLQEVNNLLLQADITRRETELYQYHAAKRFASLRRWNTFSGSERGRPQAQIEIPAGRVVPKRDSLQDVEAPRVNIPYIPEEVILASAASSSLSAPASPSAIEAAGGNQAHLMQAANSQSHSSPGAARDMSGDQAETQFLSPSSASRCDHMPPPEVKRPGILRRRSEEAPTEAEGSGQSSNIMKLPEPIVHLPPRTPKSDHSPTTPTSPASTSIAGTTGSTDDIKGSSSTLTGVTTGFTMDESFSSQASSIGKPEITTICDSAPLHKELRALRKEKSRVEKGTPTLIMRGGRGLSSAPSPDEAPGTKSTTGTPDQTIPVQQKQRETDSTRSLKPSATIETDNSLAPTVMECTDPIHTVDQTPVTTDSAGASGGEGSIPNQTRAPADTTNRRDLPPTCDATRTGSRSPRSPVTKHNYLRRQKEERETKLKDYRAISPKGSPISARGKPPLPRQNTPLRHSPSASPATDKSPRSKSVGEMDRPAPPDSPSTKPLQEAINKFEKRATVCETEDRPIELRKTPSPTLHLPRVGLVSRVRRLKPAAELLEESHRYRSGQSIYATRIMQRYLGRDEHKPAHNKENTGAYVHAMIRRLSREGTPEHPFKERDTLCTASELTGKHSSPSGPEATDNSASPFKDLTNGGKVKKRPDALNGEPGNNSPDRTLSESDIDKQVSGSSSSTKTPNRNSCEVAMVLSSSLASPTESSFKMVSSGSESGTKKKLDSTIGPTNHQSLPTLMPQGSPEGISRGRAATYSAVEKGKHSEQSSLIGTESPSSSKGKTSKTKDSSGKRSREKKEKEPGFRFPSSLSPVRRGAGRGKGGTVGVLCKQSISFDLGVSLYTQQSPDPSKSRQVRSWDPSESIKAEEAAAAAAAAASADEHEVEMRPSTSSGATGGESSRPISGSSTEGEMASSSPASGEKKKSRRFLDSSWLQKSKRFFKVSK